MNQQLALKLKLEQHTRLDDYVGASGAKLAQLSGLVFVSGATGSGKSHLLQGMCHEVTDQGATAIYLCALSILEPTVLEGLEQVDLVALDDIDDVIESPDWQLALFHLINSCKDHGTKLLLSSSSSVASLEVVLDDLSSRLKAAYLVRADELNDDQKLEVVRRKAQQRGFEMSEEVCRFILSRAERDMHHLARLVDQLDEETLRRQKKVTIPFVKAALGL